MSEDNISVAVKIRPFIPRENRERLSAQWNVCENCIFQVDGLSRKIVGVPYTFDHVFTEEKTNSEVYYAVVEPLIKSCFAGFNSTIFAYGQTSSGKTYTMMGTNNINGIIQMSVNDIFNEVHQNTERHYFIRCSYLEIYNDKLGDLLDKNEIDLKIREDLDGNIFTTAREEVVTSPEQVYQLMKLGNKIRKIANNVINERSSRSHTIFQFIIESTERSKRNGSVQISQLNLVDLAGSERIAHTKAVGLQLQEGVSINKSLSILGNVIRQLGNHEGHISYRDSKLTRLLQHALGGNSKALIITTITLAVVEETKSTLEFAQRAKAVKNKPVVNKILSATDVLKTYQIKSVDYKEILESKQSRICKMKTEFREEKGEQQREVLKLKQQWKLIGKYTKGPDAYISEINDSRRQILSTYGRKLEQEEASKPQTSASTEETLAAPIDSSSPAQKMLLSPPPLEEQELSVQTLLGDRQRLVRYCEKLKSRIKEEQRENQSLRLTHADNQASLLGLIEQLKEENANLTSKLAAVEAAVETLRESRNYEILHFESMLNDRAQMFKILEEFYEADIQKLRELTADVRPLQQQIEELLEKNACLTDDVMTSRSQHETEVRLLKEEIEKLELANEEYKKTRS